MADPLSLSTGLLTLVTFGVQSVDSLIKVIRDFQRLPSTITQLQDELTSLQKVLLSLNIILDNDSYDFSALELPVRQCGTACEEFRDLISSCTAHSEGSKRSIRNLLKLKYHGDDVDSFRRTLESYKGTISVALADANLRTTQVTLTALNQYREMIQTTSLNLEIRLEEIDARVRRVSRDSENPSQPENKWQMEQKQSVEQCIRICDQVSSHIKELSPSLSENISLTEAESHSLVTLSKAPSLPLPLSTTVSTLQNCTNQIQITSMWLKTQAERKQDQLSHLPSVKDNDEEQAEKQRLQEEIEGLRRGIEVCNEAEKKAEQRQNTFSGISTGEDSRQVLVSTVGDLIFASNVKAGNRSTQILGQMSDLSLQHVTASHPDDSQHRAASENISSPMSGGI